MIPHANYAKKTRDKALADIHNKIIHSKEKEIINSDAKAIRIVKNNFLNKPNWLLSIKKSSARK
ncbi:hypothetical protein NBRC116493_28000 [Aurantivibrio infirmus]